MRQTDVDKLPLGRHSIGDGLYVNVRETSRTWLFIYKVKGKQKVVTLGNAGLITLKLAQVKALELKLAIKSGTYVPPNSKTEPQENGSAAGVSAVAAKQDRLFCNVAEKAISVRQKTRGWKNQKHADQWMNTVRTYAFPVIGQKDVDEIVRADILTILEPIWATKTETARRLRTRLEIIFAYAIHNGLREKANPATWKGNLEFDLAEPKLIMKVTHHAALTMPEAKAVAKQLSASDGSGHLCTLFGMLTATRCQEFSQAQWSEIDFTKKIWSIPQERRKDKKKYPHRVPLSDQAMEILYRMMGRNETNVFPGQRSRFINENTPRLLLQHLTGKAVTMHGCRSTFRDWCAENGKDKVLAEKSLMHATGNEVEQAYQRSDLLEQRRSLMQEWADALIKKLKKPS